MLGAFLFSLFNFFVLFCFFIGNAGLMEGRLKIRGSYARFALPSGSQLGSVQFGNIT